MMTYREQARAELARREISRRAAQRSLATFCARMDDRYERARHIDVLVQHLEALANGEIPSLIVMMPPRSSKTYHVSERFPAWYLGRGRCQVILAGNSAELAEGASRRIRGLVSDALYPFDVHLDPDSHAVQRWQTDAGGYVIAAGVGSAITGRGADLLIIDDPVRDRRDVDSATQREHLWSWYTDAARTRLMPGGKQLVTLTRWHEDDLVGRILNSADASRWTVLSMPAIAEEGDALGRAPGEALWPQWFPLTALEQTREVLGPRSWASLYQQNPVPDAGTIFRSEWFERRYAQPPPRNAPVPLVPNFGVAQALQTRSALVVVQAIDSAWSTGPSADYSVIATWATDSVDYYLLDVWRGRVEYPELARAVVTQASVHRPNAIYVEEAASGLAILQDLRRATSLPIVGIRPTGSKESRADMVTAPFAGGKVQLPASAPWLDEWIAEHLRFPSGAHDDMVDTTSLALSQLMRAQYDKGATIRPGFAWKSR